MIGEPMELVASLVFGAALGVVVGGVFFGGLAWTVQRLVTTRAPGRLVLTSLVVRMAAAALGAWVAATAGDTTAVIALAATAIGMRTVVVKRVAPDARMGR